MPIGVLILLVVAALIFFGFAHRILDRLRLTDKQALLFIIAMIVFSFVDIPISQQPINLTVNIGGAMLPVILAIYLLLRAERTVEWMRAIVASLITAGAVWGFSRIFIGNLTSPFEEGYTFLDPSYIFAIIAGVVAYLAGRSRRSAFIAGTIGILLGDIINLIQLYVGGIPGRVSIGGAGVFDTIVIAGILAVIIAELVGETRERIQGGPIKGDGKPRINKKDKSIEYASAVLTNKLENNQNPDQTSPNNKLKNYKGGQKIEKK